MGSSRRRHSTGRKAAATRPSTRKRKAAPPAAKKSRRGRLPNQLVPPRHIVDELDTALAVVNCVIDALHDGCSPEDIAITLIEYVHEPLRRRRDALATRERKVKP
jgi:hypothetical protein